MNRWLRSVLARADAWSPRKLLWVSLALAALVGFAHGGALLALRAHPTPEAADVERLTMVSLPLVAIVLVSALAGLALSKLQRPVLALHGVLFLAAASYEVVWGAGILIRGIPAGNFSWSVGLFSLSVAYAAFVFSRFSVPAGLRATPSFYFLPVLALAIAVPIDLGVMGRFAYEINSRFGG